MKFKISIAVVVIIVVMIVILGLRQKVLGNMSESIKEPKTSSSDFSFNASKGDRIKVSLRTTVNSGSIDFILTDSKGNVIEELDRAKALETFIDIKYDDSYTLTGTYTKFTGKFSVKVSIKRF